MKTHTQPILLRLAILPLILFGLIACNLGGSSGSGTPADAAGSWRGGGNYDQGTKISSFQLNLSQDGNAVAGNYSVSRTSRDTMTGTVNGSVSGSNISITMTPHGYADGKIDGNTMNLYWYESGFGGTGGGGNVQLTR